MRSPAVSNRVRVSRSRFCRPILLVLALLLTAGIAGCGVGEDGGGIEARVLITREFGTRQVEARIVQDVPSSQTATGLLKRSFGVTARDGSLFVNGVGRAPVDDAELHDGDRIWWDRHQRGVATRVAAVVGSFPEPFAHGAEGKRYPVVLECADDVEDACKTVSERLGAAGVIAGRQTLGTGVGEKTLRVLVGRWSALRGDQALEQLDRGPAASGVYARFSSDGRRLDLLDPQGARAVTLGAGAGLVAATRFEQQVPTWVLTGTDATGVAAAARALDERTLQRRFALALAGTRTIGLPVVR